MIIYLYLIIPFILSYFIYLYKQKLNLFNTFITKDHYFNLYNDEIVQFRNITTLFFPGNGASSAQVTKLTGCKGYKGTKAYPSLNLLINPISIDPYDVERNWFSYLLYPFYYLIYLSKGITNLHPYYTNPFKINIGQDADILHARSAIRNTLKETTNDLIIVGVSRGTSTAIGAVATLNLYEQKRIKMIILEGPFDKVEKVIDSRFSFPLSIIIRFLLKLTLYDPKAKGPEDYLEDLLPEIPIVIITSKIDEIVSHERSLFLYKKLVTEKKHLIVLNSSDHSNYSSNNLSDMKIYYYGITNLYRKYL